MSEEKFGLSKRRFKGNRLKTEPLHLLIDLIFGSIENAYKNKYISKKTIDKNKQSPAHFEILNTGNGVSWCRQDTCPLKVEKKLDGKSARWFKMLGYNTIVNRGSIRFDIFKKIQKKQCVFTGLKGVKQIEVDHKNGMRNNPRVEIQKTQTLSDFQALHQIINKKKRQACKDCKNSGQRFDAKELGYPKSYIIGNERHDGSKDGCVGCLWYDVLEFRKNL